MLVTSHVTEETLDCLIQGGADLDHCDKDGYSALSLAALFGHLQAGGSESWWWMYRREMMKSKKMLPLLLLLMMMMMMVVVMTAAKMSMMMVMMYDYFDEHNDDDYDCYIDDAADENGDVDDGDRKGTRLICLAAPVLMPVTAVTSPSKHLGYGNQFILVGQTCQARGGSQLFTKVAFRFVACSDPSYLSSEMGEACIQYTDYECHLRGAVDTTTKILHQLDMLLLTGFT